MDARLDPAEFAGLAEGDAHVIRNAGGRASDDAIRSLVISHKLLGTREWFVVHHTDCGMELFTEEVMGDLLAENLATAATMAIGGESHAGGRLGFRSLLSSGTRSRPGGQRADDVRRIASTRSWPRTSRSPAISTTSKPAAWNR